jgi:isopenicillin N synthase-like dioxygenase
MQPAAAKDRVQVPGTVTEFRNAELIAKVADAKTISVSTDTTRTIPCFDLRNVDQLPPIEKTKLITEFGNALRDVGFVAVYAPELAAKIKQALEITEQYFGQSEEDLMKDWHNNKGQSGYSPKGLETAAGAKKPDNKKTFFVTENMPSWPNYPQNFKPFMQDYLQSLGKLSNQLMRYLLTYLGEEELANSNVIEKGDRRVRLAMYPIPQPGDAVGAAAHFDLNSLTVLPKPSRPGLQLLTKEGEWLPVVVPDEYVIINLGDIMNKLTAGYIKGTLHQVVLENDPNNQKPRFATILFASLPDDFKLTPFQKCAELMTKNMTPSDAGQYLSQFGNETVLDNLLGRLTEMGSFDPSDEEFIRLRKLGLIKEPSEAVQTKYAHLLGPAPK